MAPIASTCRRLRTDSRGSTSPAGTPRAPNRSPFEPSEICEKTGAPYPCTPSRLSGLAHVYSAKADYARAGEHLIRALQLTEKTQGAEHRDVAVALANLAIVYSATGDFANAEQLLERALRIVEKGSSPDPRFVSDTLNSLAFVYTAKEEYARAEPVLERSLALREKAIGAEHPHLVQVLDNLSRNRRAMGDLERSLALAERAREIEERTVSNTLAGNADAQKRAFFATLRYTTENTVSLHARYAPQSERAARLALTTLLRRKGRVLGTGADMVGTLRKKARIEDQDVLDALQKTQSELSVRTLRGPAPNESMSDHATALSALREKGRVIEEDLARRYVAARGAERPVTIEAVQRMLGADQALVELAVYRPRELMRASAEWLDQVYIAYVLRKTGAPLHVELGPAAAIDATAAGLRQALASASPTYATLARRLDEQVMARSARCSVGQSTSSCRQTVRSEWFHL